MRGSRSDSAKEKVDIQKLDFPTQTRNLLGHKESQQPFRKRTREQNSILLISSQLPAVAQYVPSRKAAWERTPYAIRLAVSETFIKKQTYKTPLTFKNYFTYWWWQLLCTSPRMWAFSGISLTTAYKCILRCLTTAQTSSPQRATWSSITALLIPRAVNRSSQTSLTLQSD